LRRAFGHRLAATDGGLSTSDGRCRRGSGSLDPMPPPALWLLPAMDPVWVDLYNFLGASVLFLARRVDV